MIFYLVVNLNHRSWKVQFNIVERVVAGAVLCGGGGRGGRRLWWCMMLEAAVSRLFGRYIYCRYSQPLPERENVIKRNYYLQFIFSDDILLQQSNSQYFYLQLWREETEHKSRIFEVEREMKEVLFYLNFYFFNNIRYYLPGWIFTEHINKHVRGINIIIVRVTTDGASSPGVCRHRQWPSVANWQTRRVIVMNIIHKVNIMSAAPLPCRGARGCVSSQSQKK